MPAVFGQGFEQGFKEVSRHGVSQEAHYAACGGVLAIALEDIKFYRLHPQTGCANPPTPFQTVKLPEDTYVRQLALAEDEVIACVVGDDGYEVLCMWQGGEDEPSVRFAPPKGSVRATAVVFGHAAIDQMLQNAEEVRVRAEQEGGRRGLAEGRAGGRRGPRGRG